MATKITQILHKRGAQKNLPILDASEIAYTVDTKEVYVGTGNENVKVLTTDATIGKLSSLKTTTKTDAVSAINEIQAQVDTGKQSIANAIKDKGGTASKDYSLTKLASEIGNIKTAFLPLGSGQTVLFNDSPTSYTSISLSKDIYQDLYEFTVDVEGYYYLRIQGNYQSFLAVSSAKYKIIINDQVYDESFHAESSTYNFELEYNLYLTKPSKIKIQMTNGYYSNTNYYGRINNVLLASRAQIVTTATSLGKTSAS